MEDERQISTEQAENLGKELNCKYFDVSAKNNINIKNSMEEIFD